MTKAELAALRLAWAQAVLAAPQTSGEAELGLRLRPAPCWFYTPPGSAKAVLAYAMNWGSCGGRIEGAHWIKRQAVEEQIRRQYGPYVDGLPRPGGRGPADWELDRDDLIALAAWDPRNGVPACQRHHGRFDGRLVNAAEPFVVYRPFAPVHVEEFVADCGLETRLEQKCPDLPADWADV